MFFEHPDSYHFNLESIYKTLGNEWLEFDLEEDTYLIKNPTTSFVTEKSSYLSQSQFADYLKENGLTFTRSKLNTYMKRGAIPDPNLVVGGAKYWERSVCENICEILLKEMLKMKTNLFGFKLVAKKMYFPELDKGEHNPNTTGDEIDNPYMKIRKFKLTRNMFKKF